jgi:hypothetical protein
MRNQILTKLYELQRQVETSSLDAHEKGTWLTRVSGWVQLFNEYTGLDLTEAERVITAWERRV